MPSFFSWYIEMMFPRWSSSTESIVLFFLFLFFTLSFLFWQSVPGKQKKERKKRERPKRVVIYQFVFQTYSFLSSSKFLTLSLVSTYILGFRHLVWIRSHLSMYYGLITASSSRDKYQWNTTMDIQITYKPGDLLRGADWEDVSKVQFDHGYAVLAKNPRQANICRAVSRALPELGRKDYLVNGKNLPYKVSAKVRSNWRR